MSKLQYFNYPGWGKQARELHNLSQVVRIGNELRISGQGGRRQSLCATTDRRTLTVLARRLGR